jgi:hypothetical protein
MSGYSKIVLRDGDNRLELSIDDARKLMMKLEEVLRVEMATLDIPVTPLNLDDWIYFPSPDSIVVSLVHIPLIKI